MRGLGGFVRSSWDEVNEIVAAANVYTIKKHGPDRVIGFSPIPAMSMVSYAAGSRYLSLIGGVCMSFYDWYCDLPPSSPQVWGEQTDVPESADWYNSSYIIAWGSNVPQTRTPDAHFFTEVRYKGTKTVAVTPDYSEVAKLCDIWMHPKQGTDAAVAMAMGHVILKEFYFPDGGKQRSAYFDDYVRRYTDMPMLVMLKEHRLPSGEVIMVPDRYVRASDFDGNLGQANNPEWKTVAVDEVRRSSGAAGRDWFSLGPRRSCRCRPVEPGSKGGAAAETRSSSSCLCSKASIQALQRRRSGFRTSAALRVSIFRITSRPMFSCALSPFSAFRWAKRANSAKPGWLPCSICRWRTTAWRAD